MTKKSKKEKRGLKAKKGQYIDPETGEIMQIPKGRKRKNSESGEFENDEDEITNNIFILQMN